MNIREFDHPHLNKEVSYSGPALVNLDRESRVGIYRQRERRESAERERESTGKDYTERVSRVCAHRVCAAREYRELT